MQTQLQEKSSRSLLPICFPWFHPTELLLSDKLPVLQRLSEKMLINLELLRDVRIMCILCVNSVPKREHYNNIKHVRLSIIQICSNIILFKDFWISINKTCRFKDLHTSFTMYCFHFNILQTICIYLIRLLFWSFRMCIKYN